MPREVPFRKIASLEPARAGALAYIAGVLLMLAISCVTLVRHPDDVHASGAPTLLP